MKMKKLTAVAVVALLGSLSANAQILFQDTFDGGGAPWGDLSFNLAARQAGGTTNSTYTLTGDGEVPGDSVIYNDAVLMRIHNTSNTDAGGSVAFVNLDTDFGPDLLNTTWTLSFSSVRTGSGIGAGWSGFSVGINNPPYTPFANGFGFILQGLGGWAAFNGEVQVGSGSIPYGAAHHWYDIIATFDEGADTVSLDFIDDLDVSTNLGTFPTTFTNGTTRFVGFRNHVDGIAAETWADMYIENLQIEVNSSIPPPEIGDIVLDLLSGTNAVSLTWSTGSGYGYTLESKSSLLDVSWGTNTTGIVGTGGDVTVTTAVDQAESFYRVIGE